MRTREEYKRLTEDAIEKITKLANYSNYFRRWLHERSSNKATLLWEVEKELAFLPQMKVDVCSGYNKTTLIFNDGSDFDEDWVVKFPKNVTPKEQTEEGRWTACDREVEYYDVAVQEGLENFFAECWKDSFELDGEEIPFYIMQRAVVDEEEVYSLSDSDDYAGEDAVWEAFSNVYGDEIMRKLYTFCEDYDINDLHEGNVGFIWGSLVCIDYSGYIGGEEDGEYEW